MAIVLSQPYGTAARIAKAPKRKLAINTGIGSDHVNLQAAMDRGITVAEVTYCNSISVAEGKRRDLIPPSLGICRWGLVKKPRFCLVLCH